MMRSVLDARRAADHASERRTSVFEVLRSAGEPLRLDEIVSRLPHLWYLSVEDALWQLHLHGKVTRDSRGRWSA